MRTNLDQLAAAYGIELSYVSDAGGRRRINDAVKRALLKSLGVDARDDKHIAREIARAAPLVHAPVENHPCFVPTWLREGRCWGIVCQLYALRSSRNLGIGDFEDLAVLCEIAAAAGADFIGTNPLHALFLPEPGRCSPYAPSTRRFINPLYIAVDRVEAANEAMAGLPHAEVQALRDATLIDYGSVARLKRQLLQYAFAVRGRQPGFDRYRDHEGQALRDFATFEALSSTMQQRGLGSGWHAWPVQYRNSRSPAVMSFARTNASQVDFHAWLQWICAEQLASVQARARAAGMRIGLYLDLAVGVSPDGAATWRDPGLVIPAARIGAPPDRFNAQGQDWGLAPMSPAILRERDCEPFARDIEAVMRFAGAIRIDHAMGLHRLYWVPEHFAATSGSYLRYPTESMLRMVVQASHLHRALVIGEDLGTVPAGFRNRMRRAEIQSYRVLLFERRPDATFIAPDSYPREALACLGTHDLPTQEGWWRNHDIEVRRRLGIVTSEAAATSLRQRAQDRRALIHALAAAGLLPGALSALSNLRGSRLPRRMALASHRFVARTPSRLMAAQLEDLTGAIEQVNLPGTHLEYPNWKRPLPVRLEELPQHPLFQQIAAAIAAERPRPS
jgi:4-alpha-glucanotransferase